jgi:LPS sulfotransferase NodH
VIFLPEETVQAHGVHLSKVAAEIDTSADSNTLLNLRPGLRFCFICFTNRSGSNYVAEAMASTGELNLAGEIYNWDMVLNVSRKHGIANFRDYFCRLANSSAINGIVLAKVAIDHIVLLYKTAILEEIVERSEFVMVERGDKLAQSISFSIAKQSGKWTSYSASQNDEEPEYQFNRILGIMKSMIRQNAYFDEFFAVNGLCPTSIIYEQFAENPEIYTAYIAGRLGLNQFEMQPTKVRTEKQAGPINRLWRQKFLQDVASGEMAKHARSSRL